MKPKIMVFPFDLLSHYLRTMELVKPLKDDFEILFMSSTKYNGFLSEEGIKTFDCTHFNAEEVLAQAGKFDFSWLNRTQIENILKCQLEAIQMHRSALVVGDTAPTLKMAAALTNTPYVSLMNGYMTKYYAIMRPLPRAHFAAPLASFVPPNWFEKIIRFGETQAFRKIEQEFNEVRQKYGLPPKEMYLDELEGDLNLICDLAELFPQRSLPENYHIIGPLLNLEGKAKPDWTAALQNGKPTVLVTAGSSGDLKVFQKVTDSTFSAFNILIAGAGAQQYPQPHNIAQPFMPLAAVMDLVDVMLTHGGNGSIYHALAHGVPVLCRPQIFEQEWNVHRVAAFGLGQWLPEDLTADELKDTIERWLPKARKADLALIARKIKTVKKSQAVKIQKLFKSFFKVKQTAEIQF